MGLSLKSILKTQKKRYYYQSLLNRNEQNIREYLTYVEAKKIEDSNIKTRDNLEAVRNIFEQAGLIDVMKKIDDDLLKIK